MTAPGTLMAGRYRLVERIAAGGMGWVWEAWDELLHRKVAVKQLLLQQGVAPEDAELARHRLIREARLTARLHHPHVVTLYDVVEHEGCPCLIMQYVPSQSLNAVLQERGALSEAAVTRIAAEVAAGLAAAHEVGIVHRDVKPGNVLITADGSAKLTDFGISHAAGDATLTATGMVTGTPAYLAPEVARGGNSGFPADVFSFGATLYAALEGTPPFGTDPNPMAILHRVASGQMIPQGWERLTPTFQNGIARNREYYDRFWGSIDDTVVEDVTAVSPDTVEATVTYYFKDGRVSVERTVYTVVRDDSGFKIDDSEVLSGQS